MPGMITEFSVSLSGNLTLVKFLLSFTLCCILLLSLGVVLAGDFKKEHGTPVVSVPDNDSKILLRKVDRIINNAEKISGKYPKPASAESKNSLSKKNNPAGKVSSSIPSGIKSYFIMNKGSGSREQIVRFILKNNTLADQSYVFRLVNAYLIESKREGVNHDIAVCQMCLETGFLKFSGSVSHYQNNFCGLGATDPWSAGDSFRNMEEGVRAHIQHLKAYASKEPIVPPYVDPRLDHVKRGSAQTIHDLTGRWASDPGYGDKIEGLLKQLHSQ